MFLLGVSFLSGNILDAAIQGRVPQAWRSGQGASLPSPRGLALPAEDPAVPQTNPEQRLFLLLSIQLSLRLQPVALQFLQE